MKITLIANDTTFIYNLRREVLKKLIEEGHQLTVLSQLLTQEVSIIKILFSNADFSYFECTTLFTKIFLLLRLSFFITKTKKILIRIDEKILKVKNNKK